MMSGNSLTRYQTGYYWDLEGGSHAFVRHAAQTVPGTWIPAYPERVLGSPHSAAAMHLQPEQQRRAARFLNTLPWADVDGSIRSLEDALRLALEATSDDFYRGGG